MWQAKVETLRLFKTSTYLETFFFSGSLALLITGCPVGCAAPFIQLCRGSTLLGFKTDISSGTRNDIFLWGAGGTVVAGGAGGTVVAALSTEAFLSSSKFRNKGSISKLTCKKT